MMKKKLSLIIPSYNCAAFLDETIGSVLSQLPDDCELVVTDDGSSDETPSLLLEYEKKYSNLRVALRAHEGVSGARNAGIDIAEGEWVTFMDCDDTLKEGFFEKALPLISGESDLYIFSFERVEFADGEELVFPLMLADRQYMNASEFADDYVRIRHLLVYSACNKFYRRELLDRHGIRFRRGMSFGEDRLFNYEYLMHCGAVETSSVRMFRYMQRNTESASKRSFPDYFEIIMKLHAAKMDCFLTLSEGTTHTEKRAFRGYDLSTEVGRMIDRFADHPQEKEETLPKINRLLFGEPDDISGRYDLIIVLGSRDCGYRAEKAFEIAGKDEDTVYLVTGGNMHKDGEHTEAGYMADYLMSQGVNESQIMIEAVAENTFRNLELSAEMIERRFGDRDLRIGIVTAGFHIPRTRLMLTRIPWYEGKNIVFIPAYGVHTRPDNWYSDPTGKSICLSEIAKAASMV